MSIRRLFKRWVASTGIIQQSRIIASLYVPDQHFATPRTYYTQPEPAAWQAGGETVLPLPPLELRMGYGSTDAEYLQRGANTAACIRQLLSRHGVVLAAGDCLLDWGCATGRVLRHFADAAATAECWGTDIIEKIIAWDRQHLAPPFRFVTCSVYPHLPFPDNYFSVVYGISVFTHIAHLRDTWLMEIRRVLRPGGLAVFTVHDEHTAALLQRAGRPSWLPANLALADIAGQDVTVITGETTNLSYVFTTSGYIRRVWGQYLTVCEIAQEAEGYQTAVVLRKK